MELCIYLRYCTISSSWYRDMKSSIVNLVYHSWIRERTFSIRLSGNVRSKTLRIGKGFLNPFARPFSLVLCSSPSVSLSLPLSWPGARLHAFNNSWLCRTRDSSWIFHVCTAGNAVVAEKSNYSRATEDPRVLHFHRRADPEIASPRWKRTRPHAQRGSDPRHRVAVKVHFIFKRCGDITQSAAFSMQLCCTRAAKVTHRLP